LAASVTAAKRARLSLIEQFMFFLEKLSEAAPKIAISLTPAASCEHGRNFELFVVIF